MGELNETIENVAAGPKSVTTDGTTVQSQDIDSLIKADKHLAGGKSLGKSNRGLRFNRIVPPGTTE